MNRNFKINAVYFYMAIVGAAMVPAMANAQQADNGDGPRVVYYDEETQPAGPVTSGNGSAPSTTAAAPAAGAEGASGASASKSGDAHVPNAYLGGSMGGSAAQGYNVGAQGGYYNHGANIGASATLGTSGNIFQAQLQANNIRTNGYDAQSFTVAGLVNGTASIGTAGEGTANGVAGAVAVIPFKVGNLRCSLLAGPVGGGMYSNRVAGAASTAASPDAPAAEGSKEETAAAGPGGYAGIPCDIGGFNFVAGNHTLFNALNSTDPNNATKAAGQANLTLMYRFTPNAALGANATIDYDIRDAKSSADWMTTGFLRYTWDAGGSNATRSAD